MKYILFFITLFFLESDSFGQRLMDSSLIKEEYLAKSKRSRTTGRILLATGTAVTIVGIVVINNSLKQNGTFDPSDIIGPLIALSGGVVMVISLPYFVNASNQRKKAAKITMSHQRIQLPLAGINAIASQPTITLRIGL